MKMEYTGISAAMEDRPPCMSRMVDGFVRLGMAGVGYGFFMGSYEAAKEGHKGSKRAMYVVNCAGKNSISWGCLAGMYFGLNCGIEGLRGKRDWVNASVAGAITGAAITAKTGRALQILGGSVALSTLATAVELFHSELYPST